MTPKEFIQRLQNEPETLDFEDTIAIIEQLYSYTPVTFYNGQLINHDGENEGSCKIFAFAKQMNFSEQETLHCFGRFYRNDVINNPNADNHQNIRQFMRTGWEGIKFNELPLNKKS